MSGCWEQGRQARVICGILHVDVTTIAWAFGLRNLILPGEIMGVAGMPFDMARNSVCMKALEVGASHVFFLDSDVVPPRDAVLRLLHHNLPIVSGVYCRRSPPHGIPVMIKNGQWVTSYPPNALIEVDVCGAGCLLISTDVLRKLPPQAPGRHWFHWKVDQRGVYPDGECVSEDFAFNQHARKHGFKTIIDTSIQCKHVGYAQAGHGTFGPLEASPVT